MASRRKNVGETSHDEIGFWSQIKLDILKKYWPAYTTVVKKQSWNFHTLYIDAFAGSGRHISRQTGEFIAGSPARALDVQPPFDEYHFIDLDEAKVRSLESLAAERSNVQIHHGDCNTILLNEVFPQAKYEKYRRAVCLLDPYSLQLDWSVIRRAGEMQSVEIFLNFPILDMNRNVFHDAPSAEKISQMNRFWGDESWREQVYVESPMLFGPPETTKVDNGTVADAFRKRLKNSGGFAYVPEPMAMRNSKNATVYYLFFAGNNETGARIVSDIFKGYREQGYG